MSEAGTYRVYPDRDPGAWRLVDLETYEPTSVAAEGYDDGLAERVAALRPGYLVDATLDAGSPARIAELSVRDRTLVEFVDGVTGVFEAARETWRAVRNAGETMGSRVTRDTDGRPNGALYVFADPPGGDLLAEFRAGSRPLDPLIERAGDEPLEAFVMRPAAGEYVLVYLVLGKHSILADTVRDTYDCPRPTEPRVDESPAPSDG